MDQNVHGEQQGLNTLHSMRAFSIDSVGSCSVREVSIPIPKDDEVLIKVMAVGICGTDVHLFLGDYDNPYPTIPGHEFSGIVVAVGEKVTNITVGQRVAVDPNVYCEACDSCRENRQNYCQDYRGLGNQIPGAFQQFMVINHRSVFDIGNLPFTVAAMAEPLACVLHGQQRARPNYLDKVLIFGAGPIGLLHLQVCRSNGAADITVVDIKERQLELALEMGANQVINNTDATGEAFQRIAPQGFDIIIECTGVSKVVQQAIPLLRTEGRLLLFGVCPAKDRIQVSPYDIYQRELHFIGSNSLKKTFLAAIGALQLGAIRVKELTGDRISLEELPMAIKKIAEEGQDLKTMVYPNGMVD